MGGCHGWRSRTQATSIARLPLLILLLLLLAAAAPRALADDLPALTGPVTDLAGVIDAASAARIDDLSRRLQGQSGDVVAVLTIRTFQPGYADLREYAVKAFENRGRGIGERGKDNGVLVVLAVDDRRVHIEVGYGLEGAITDGFAGETARLYMRPAFQRGAYGEGLADGVTRLVARIAEERGLTMADLPRAPRSRPAADEIRMPTWMVLLLLLALYLMLRASRRRGRGSRHWTHGGSGWGGGTGWSGWSGGGSFGGGSFGGGFGGFGGGRSGGGGGGASW